MIGLFWAAFGVSWLAPWVLAFNSYPNEFIRVNYTLAGNWNQSTVHAQKTIIAAADFWAAQGPWSVTNKTILPSSGNVHDYLSWRPYYWPNCTSVGNTTELTPEQIWTTCPYIRRDGQFNPDVRLVNDTGSFQAMSDGVFYNTLAWRITEDPKYVKNVVLYLDTWFLNPNTFMNPHLDYAQTLRGPVTGEARGSHEGVLDLKGMAKVSGAVLILRATKAPQWTAEMDAKLNEWCNTYITWLKTSPLALEEKAATNNHGSFYFTQLAAIQVIVGDHAGARTTLEEYYGGIFLNQIDASGEQPLEASRTRPYHYRAYNAMAIITNGRIGDYIGYNTWNLTASSGATVQTAVDHAMKFGTTPEDADPNELFPAVAAIASTYGDPTGKYAAFLAEKEPQYPSEAWFFYNQPLWDSGIVIASTRGNNGSTTDSTVPDTPKSSSTQSADSRPKFVMLFAVLGTWAFTLL